VTLISPGQWQAGKVLNDTLDIVNANPYPINVKSSLAIQGDVIVTGLQNADVSFSGPVVDSVDYMIPAHQITWDWINVDPPRLADALLSSA